MGYIEKASGEGARLAHRTEFAPPYPDGFYVAPVIFDKVRANQRIAQEEIFGPVLSVLTFNCEEEAIRIANETIYGLSAILWTRGLARAHRVAYELDVGWTVVNATENPGGGPTLGSLAVGGHKQSGWGIEGGFEGLKHYMTQTAVQIFV